MVHLAQTPTIVVPPSLTVIDDLVTTTYQGISNTDFEGSFMATFRWDGEHTIIFMEQSKIALRSLKAYLNEIPGSVTDIKIWRNIGHLSL